MGKVSTPLRQREMVLAGSCRPYWQWTMRAERRLRTAAFLVSDVMSHQRRQSISVAATHPGDGLPTLAGAGLRRDKATFCAHIQRSCGADATGRAPLRKLPTFYDVEASLALRPVRALRFVVACAKSDHASKCSASDLGSAMHPYRALLKTGTFQEPASFPRKTVRFRRRVVRLSKPGAKTTAQVSVDPFRGPWLRALRSSGVSIQLLQNRGDRGKFPNLNFDSPR